MVDDAPPPTWHPVPRQRAHELVIDAIEEQIVAGALRVGDSLPPERDLAARLGVSRAGVREAVRVLEGQGILRSQRGAGPDAGTFVSALPREALTRFLRLHVALSSFRSDDVVDARIVLERASVARAATHPESLEPVRAALGALDDAGTDLERFNDADTAFHIAIAEASGSELSAALTAAIRSSVRGSILRGMRELDDPAELLGSFQQQHREILAALEEGAADRAAELTEAHIRTAWSALPHSTGLDQG